VYVHARGKTRRSAWKLLRALRRSRPDVVHCHNKTPTIHAAMIARLAGSRAVISTRHGLVARPWRLRKELRFWIVAAMLCDRVVAVCDAASRNMTAGARPVAHRIVTIRNGADAPLVSDQPVGARSGFTLISVGRLVRAKSFDTLIRAVAAARAAVPDLGLWIVGAGTVDALRGRHRSAGRRRRQPRARHREIRGATARAGSSRRARPRLLSDVFHAGSHGARLPVSVSRVPRARSGRLACGSRSSSCTSRSRTSTQATCWHAKPPRSAARTPSGSGTESSCAWSSRPFTSRRSRSAWWR